MLELLKEEKIISQLAAEYKVHSNLLRDWRTLAVKKLSALFDKHDDVARLRISLSALGEYILKEHVQPFEHEGRRQIGVCASCFRALLLLRRTTGHDQHHMRLW